MNTHYPNKRCATLPAHQQALGGFTLLELMIVVAILALLAAIAGPVYRAHTLRIRNSQAIADIALLSAEIARYRSNNAGQLPGALTDLTGVTIPTDPWGNAYSYMNIEDATKVNPSKVRWDKNLKPINVDYDLYSIGPDGQSKQKITDKESLDDIIRANGGEYLGLANEY